MHASIESLPLDALVQILCKLNHDELRPLLGVSKSFHDAACVARRLHFDFSTPETKKPFTVTDEPEWSPGAKFMRLELKRSQRFKLPEEETRKLAVVLFPEGDCKRHHLIPGFGCLLKHNQSLVHASHAKA